ncbi:MAG: helix-turn-helix transcriptional regulator [Eubacteriales bacterium]|nr:helix-turn-helix transcriptional regulator [Eubacteriales bacterium]
MQNTETFGAFLKARRKEREITVRLMAELVGIAVGSYCDIESNRNYPPSKEILEKMIEVLRLSEADQQTFYDLAGKARSAAPPDLPEYINDNEVVRFALRVAKEKASDEDWRRFINELEHKE